MGIQEMGIDARTLLPRSETAKAGHDCQSHSRQEIHGTGPTAGTRFTSPDLRSLLSLLAAL